MKKQDRQAVRTPAALEQKYDLASTSKNAAEARQAAAEAKRAAAEAEAVINALSVPKDYIVEEGASGKWSYEKWASGKAVCWCTTDPVAVNYANALNDSSYYSSVSYPFPENLFTSTPSFACVNSISSDGLLSERITEISTSAISWLAIVTSAQTVTRSVQFLIEAKGTWKGVE